MTQDKPTIMNKDQLKLEINHIIDSGANDIRLMELFERFAASLNRQGWEEEVLGFDLWKNTNYKPIEEGNYQGLFRHRTSSEIRGLYTSKELYDSYQTMKHLNKNHGK